MTLASFRERFDTGWFTGTPTSTEVPDAYPCALDSHGYLIDQSGTYPRNRASIPVTRDTLAGSQELGENTLNPDAGWRRSQSSWHRGAGQTRLDDPESDRTRFHASKGINPWTRWELSLLNDTQHPYTISAANPRLVRCSSLAYVADGTALRFTPDLVSFGDCQIQAGAPAQPIKDLASDGARVFAALGPGGVHVTTAGAVTSASFSTQPADTVAWVKSRLIASDGPALIEIDPAGTPAILFTHPVGSFAWVGHCEGDSCIYSAGFAGDKSVIYRTGIKSDGSGLAAPVPAGELPDGEVVSSIGFYLGFVLIGTTRGVRIASPNADGDLQIGALIPTASPVQCLEPQGQFVWFGWSNYDSASTGLGRLNLAYLNDDTPAFASDLMAPTQGAVTGVITFGDLRVFTVAGSGLWAETGTPVASGYVDTGLVSFGITDRKTALSVQARHASYPAGAGHGIDVAVDGGDFTSLGTVLQGGSLSGQQFVGEAFEIRHTLTPGPTGGPVLRRWGMLTLPIADLVERFTVPLQLRASEMNLRRNERRRDLGSELDFLVSLKRSGKVFTYQEYGSSWPVRLTDYTWYPEDDQPSGGAGGVMVVVLTTVNV